MTAGATGMRWWVLALPLALVACASASGGGDAADAGGRSDAGDGDAGSGLPDAGAPDGSCGFDDAELPDCESFGNVMLPVASRTGTILTAAELGDRVSFAPLGNLGVLARRPGVSGSEPFLVALRPDPRAGTLITTSLGFDWPDAGGPFDIRAVWVASAPDPAFDADAFALACDAGGCAVLAADTDTQDVLSPRLPDSGDIAPVGLSMQSGRLCVFGAGVQCHHGSAWQEVVAQDASRPIRALALGEPSLAAGDGGRAFVEDGQGFTELSTDAVVDLSLVSGQSGDALLAGDALWMQRDEGQWSWCSLRAPLAYAALLAGPAHTPAQVRLDSEGRITRYHWDVQTGAMRDCYHATLAGEAVIGHARPRCGDVDNPLVLTASSLQTLLSRTLVCVQL